MLSPRRALAYLREVQPGTSGVALIGPRGVLLIGEEGAPAGAARALQAAGAARSLDGSLVCLAVGPRVIAAYVADPPGALVEYDLRCVASAADVTFGG